MLVNLLVYRIVLLFDEGSPFRVLEFNQGSQCLATLVLCLKRGSSEKLVGKNIADLLG